MKIKKIGHCCLVIETGNIRIIIDPGVWSRDSVNEKNIGLILITHEHPDHLHIDSVKALLQQSPKAQVISTQSISVLLQKENIPVTVLNDEEVNIFSRVKLEGTGKLHADIYEDITPVQNIGFLIEGRFFYPGDAFTLPGKSVEILALPVAGPWMTVAQSLDYARTVKPKSAFPVHDGMLNTLDFVYNHYKRVLPANGIEFLDTSVSNEIKI